MYPSALHLLILVSCALHAATPAWVSLRDLGRWKLLRGQVDSALAAKPQEPELLAWKSRLTLAWGRAEEAQTLARQAVALKPGCMEAQCALGMATMRLIGATSNPFKKLALCSEGRKACEAALALDPRCIPALQHLVGFHAEAPGIAGGDPKQSEAWLRVLTSVDPAQAALCELTLPSHRSDAPKVEAGYRKALAANPRSPQAHSGLAQHLLQASRTQEALVHAREAVRLEPRWVDGHTALARACVELGLLQDLEAVLRQAEVSLPENPYPAYAAARALLLKGMDLPRAERLFKAYLTQEPEAGAPSHARARWRLALVLEKLGRKAEALAELQTAARQAPEDTLIQQDLKRMK